MLLQRSARENYTSQAMFDAPLRDIGNHAKLAKLTNVTGEESAQLRACIIRIVFM